MKKAGKSRPTGGKGKRGNYDTVTVRVPLPLLHEVKALIDSWHEENERYMSLPMKGHWWEVLGVSPDASADEVQAAYRKLARLYHPDVNLRRDANERLAALNKAKELTLQKS